MNTRGFAGRWLKIHYGELNYYVERVSRARHHPKITKGFMQTLPFQIHDPVRAQAYFEDKLAFTTGPIELDRMLKNNENLVVVDVRAAGDFDKGHVPGAINLPKGRWENPQGLQKDKTNVVYCYSQVCHLAASACAAFASQGFPVMELEGGFQAWREHDLDIEPEGINRLKKAGERLLHRRH
jgi:rhodanese-related sulfurtransferase